MEEKKKGKTRSCYSNIPTDVVFEKILIRVPAKSLMRFKLVCKLWQSTILHDRRFHESHHHLSPSRPSLLTFVGTYYPLKWYKPAPSIQNQFPIFFSQSYWENIPTKDLNESLLTFVDTHDPDKGVSSIENRFVCTSIPSYDSNCTNWEKTVWKDYYTTEVVNGLVCFYSEKSDDLYLCNLSTSETMKLPSSPVFTPPCKTIYNYVCPKFLGYYLGFDEVNNVYKLLKIEEQYCYIRNTPNSKILTIQYNYNEKEKNQEACWRNTTIRGMVEYRRTYCFRSALYWIVEGYLICFDLIKESYLIIRHPHNPEPTFCMWNHHGRYFDCLEAGLTQIGGRLALTHSYAGATEFNIWLLDHNNKQQIYHNHMLYRAKWDKITIPIPIHLREPSPFPNEILSSSSFLTIPCGPLPAGTNNKIFFTVGRTMLYKPTVGFHIPVYTYDMESKTWETLDSDCLPPLAAASSLIQAAYKNYSQIYYFHEDNIFPLKDILAPK